MARKKGQGGPSTTGQGQGQGQGTAAGQDADFQRRRFEWGAGVLERLGATARVTAARSIRELDAIALDDNAVEVEIINVLHSGNREAHFVGLSAKQLRHILRNRLDDLKKDRRRDLQRAAPSSGHDGPQVNVLDLVLRLIEDHIAITPEERMATALWILHTYVYDRFDVTPRLAALSPVRGCGKTTLLILLECLTLSPYRSDNVTAAAIYHLVDDPWETHSLLVDEGDNLGLLNNAVLRAVFNSGHRRGGGISRFVGGQTRKFNTFAPLAAAAIGLMPMPLLHRSVIINMQRVGGPPLPRLDELNPVWPAARAEITKWAATCQLAGDPEMPSALRNRVADNWRVLLAIADHLGHGEEARAAAVALSSKRPDEDPGVVLLTDIRDTFQRLAIDRIASAALVDALHHIEGGLWADWRGVNDDRPPRKLNQSELARLLRPFGIHPRTVWPVPRRADSKSSMGYMRSQFESAWAAYCSPDNTSTQASKIMHLVR
jgi:Protein of unknown function (DUF3631)